MLQRLRLPKTATKSTKILIVGGMAALSRGQLGHYTVDGGDDIGALNASRILSQWGRRPQVPGLGEAHNRHPRDRLYSSRHAV
jgi:hypothetical protein